MTDVNPNEVLFLGLGRSVVNWFRCGLPASALGCDWAGYVGDAPDWQLVTGNLPVKPDLEQYKVVVIQQPWEPGWHDEIIRLRSKGVVVLYELDDCLHAVPNQSDHGRKQDYDDERLEDHVECMRMCDGAVVSTPFLKSYYENLGAFLWPDKVWVCRNGLDLARYDVTRPESRPHINVGWAGGSGHRDAVRPWMDAISDIMDDRDDVGFINVGEPVAKSLKTRHEGRVMWIPWGSIENYPAILSAIDVAIAPANDTDFYLGKSDLRVLEAGAVGSAVLADPLVYGHLAREGAWMTRGEPEDVFANLWMMLDDREVIEHSATRLREYVKRERSIEAVSADWVTAIEGATR